MPLSPRRKDRRTQPVTPLVPVILLFVVYSLIGLLVTLPAPPYWVWAGVIAAIPLLALGLNRPVIQPRKRDRGELMAYLGGLLMAIALAVAANYIGSENSFEDARFFAALMGLVALTLSAVFLTAIAAIVSTITGAQLMSKLPYSRSIFTVITVSFLGVVVGGIGGLLFESLTRAAA